MPQNSTVNGFFSSPRNVFSAAIALRAILLGYGFIQDALSPMKYTDIDYFVFTDAARFISQGRSPYTRDTYRYTPLLAWLIYPTTFTSNAAWFSFGKVLFAAGDIVAGFLILRILTSASASASGLRGGMGRQDALKYASIWLLNPMVAQISTRGSSEGLLCVLVVALLWAVVMRRVLLAGFLLGFAVHFKIYPFIYAASIVWWLDERRADGDSNEAAGMKRKKQLQEKTAMEKLVTFFNPLRIQLALSSAITFTVLNGIMYKMYGWPYIQHSYLHHFTRIDHRHNFSPYNTLLYINSSATGASAVPLESLAFIPQLLLSLVTIPLVLAKKDLPSTMLAQTFAFVTFNKVCTSQYFLWYLIFLPFYLPTSSLIKSPKKGITALSLWILGQAAWLQQGYQLEFLGHSTFVPGLFWASILFFGVNIWLLGVIVSDVGGGDSLDVPAVGNVDAKKTM